MRNDTDDPIDRQAAIEAMTNTLWHYPNECYRNLNEYEFAKGVAELGLKSVPSVQPERKTGKWIEYDNSHCECPFCHVEWSYFDNEVECFNYCPNCGARLEDENESD